MTGLMLTDRTILCQDQLFAKPCPEKTTFGPSARLDKGQSYIHHASLSYKNILGCTIAKLHITDIAYLWYLFFNSPKSNRKGFLD